MNQPKVKTVDMIYNEYGYKPNTLKYMRDNPKANKGDHPAWFPVGNRPHYPTDQFEAWHQRQTKKRKEHKSEISKISKKGKIS
tara:strand:+ start:700 stop:948 length:249 start_codon:yes stop_codon:yes gene_type:complete